LWQRGTVGGEVGIQWWRRSWERGYICSGAMVGKNGGRSKKKAARKGWERVESFGEMEEKEKKNRVFALCLRENTRQTKKISGKGLFDVCHL
jgi:hypothetical protein